VSEFYPQRGLRALGVGGDIWRCVVLLVMLAAPAISQDLPATFENLLNLALTRGRLTYGSKSSHADRRRAVGLTPTRQPRFPPGENGGSAASSGDALDDDERGVRRDRISPAS
jgi:hypothetical protein